ncbi:lipase family protein [Rhodococcus sp. NPDC055112]
MRLLACLLLTAALVTGATSIAGAQPVSANSDPFYSPPKGFEAEQPGAILRERTVELASFSTLPFDARAWQLLYRTTDLDGEPTATVTTVILPGGPVPAGGRPLLSYQVAQDSGNLDCAPSIGMRAGSGIEAFTTQGEMTFLPAALHEGWAVSVPDHQGPRSALLAPREPGYAVLDGIRAAQRFAPLGLAGAKTPVAAWGYSGGGLASGWAAEMQPSYAPELDIRGVALGSPVPEPLATMGTLSGTVWSGLQLVGLSAFQHSFPAAARSLEEHLTPEGKRLMDEATGRCLARNLASGVMRDNAPLFTIPIDRLVELPGVADAFDEMRLGRHSPTAPVYVYSGVIDEVDPIDTVDRLVERYCEGGTPVTYRRDSTGLHTGLMLTGAPDAKNWLRARLTGAPVGPGCDTQTVTSTLLSPGAVDTYATSNLQTLQTMLGVPIR